jgi:hypothetical protein
MYNELNLKLSYHLTIEDHCISTLIVIIDSKCCG